MFEYKIVGGYLKIDKSVFVREMLIKQSPLRTLLNWKGTSDFANSHPVVSEADADNIITIDFSNTTYVGVGDSPTDILEQLKIKYRDKLKGKIYCRGGIYTFEIDLDTYDDKVVFINS